MTILPETSAAVSQCAPLPIPPAYGPSTVTHMDVEEPARAVVRLAVAVTRDELVYALSEHYALMGEMTAPDALSVAEVRQMVEWSLQCCSAVEIQCGAAGLWNDVENWPAAERECMQSLARAVDRAYPPAASPVALVDGVSVTEARCTAEGCRWTSAAGSVEQVTHDGLTHAEAAHQAQGR
ncbi:hypothetical protein [Streptomyces sp. DH37]|uniref:hypothetical protein n=1 Tax=Streptomyces sp. DH37 TaxID=3040122 RepID=UPI0024415339|nr:hypothetical protein [Streptomyces sp. DH37]MDG9706269.1 hypothetical protein [Streptomyces sp. DH37]